MPAYTIAAVSDQVRDWNSERGGPMKSYRLTLKDAQGAETQNVEWSRKATSPAPAVGQSVEGDVTQGQYGPKFKAAAPAGGGAGGFKPRDPAERRSIAMQHAQKCAVTILEVAAGHGDYTPPDVADVVGQVKTVAQALFAQVQQAESAPSPTEYGTRPFVARPAPKGEAKPASDIPVDPDAFTREGDGTDVFPPAISEDKAQALVATIRARKLTRKAIRAALASLGVEGADQLQTAELEAAVGRLSPGQAEALSSWLSEPERDAA